MALPARISKPSPARSAVKKEEKRQRTAAAHVKLVGQIDFCAATGTYGPVDAHHLMSGVERGMSYKAAGRYTIPLRHDIHMRAQQSGRPEAWLMENYGLDARALTDALWAVSGDLEAMKRATIRAHQEAQLRLRERQ